MFPKQGHGVKAVIMKYLLRAEFENYPALPMASFSVLGSVLQLQSADVTLLNKCTWIKNEAVCS